RLGRLIRLDAAGQQLTLQFTARMLAPYQQPQRSLGGAGLRPAPPGLGSGGIRGSILPPVLMRTTAAVGKPVRIGHLAPPPTGWPRTSRREPSVVQPARPRLRPWPLFSPRQPLPRRPPAWASGVRGSALPGAPQARGCP